MGSANVQHPGGRDRRGVWWGPRMLLTGSRKLREDHAFHRGVTVSRQLQLPEIAACCQSTGTAQVVY